MLSSPLIPSVFSDGAGFSVHSINLRAAGHLACPVTQMDDFRVSSAPFGPHPHAGFCAVSYVFSDSPGALRSRDSLGNDLEVGPGGIVWTQAGRGLLHHELPANAGVELHGLQFFVNLSRQHKLADPAVLSLQGDDVPIWRDEQDNQVRVVVGEFGAVRSPMKLLEPFTLLDVRLREHLSLLVPEEHCGILYVLSGSTQVVAESGRVEVGQRQAIIATGRAKLDLLPIVPTHLVYLAGALIDEPQVAAGPFLMNTEEQIDDAEYRFRNGDMGSLAQNV